jgi:putative ABC transport system permease protein
MNVMVISVTQRTAEVGLLKALGARPADVRAAFLCEATLLSLLGALLGLGAGRLVAGFAGDLYPALHGSIPPYAIFASVGTALVAGGVFGVWPAQRAARLDPVQALGRR